MDAVATAAPNNSLRQRMLQDMKMLGLVGYKQKGYIRYVRRITSSQSRFSPAGPQGPAIIQVNFGAESCTPR